MRKVALGPQVLVLITAACLLISCGRSGSNGPQTSGPPFGTQPPQSNSAKTNPKITWDQPAPITYPTPLSSAQLDATANVPGTFVYSPPVGTVPQPGLQRVSATFKPTDTADYNTATAFVTVVVNQQAGVSNCSNGQPTSSATYVYVSTDGTQTGGLFHVDGFSVASDGSLTSVPGSPFTTPGHGALVTVGTGSSLFGADGYSIYSFAVHSDGCLSLENSVAAGQLVGDIIGPSRLFLDPQNANLYSFDFVPAEESYYESYSFDSSSGQITPVNETATNMANNAGVIAFSSNDEFAVTANGSIRGGIVVSEFQRSSNGALNWFGYGPFPVAAPGEFYDTQGATADGTNHFVIPVQPHPTGMGLYNPANGPWQLAVYTIDSAGNLSTTSTWQNMASAGIPSDSQSDSPSNYMFSPDDRYFSISSYMALVVFTWDSAKEILTPIATINNTEGSCTNNGCTGSGFHGLAWDRYDHLYSLLGKQLLVYTVNSSGTTPAPGSPYPMQNPSSITIINTGAH